VSRIRAIVGADEPRARARMRRLLDEHADVVVIDEAGSGREALTKVLAERPDVVFLDVRMPDGTGTEVAEQLVTYLPETVRPAVIFTTAHAEHAVEAFAVQGLDYLLKPVERERLSEALRRLRKLVWERSPAGVAAPAPANESADPVLTGYRGAREEPVPAESIRVVEIDEGVAFAQRVDGSRIRLDKGLAELEALLPTPPFARVSRSAIVHTGRVVALRPTGSSCEVELEGGHTVAVSRRRVRHLRGLLGFESS